MRRRSWTVRVTGDTFLPESYGECKNTEGILLVLAGKNATIRSRGRCGARRSDVTEALSNAQAVNTKDVPCIRASSSNS
jgi:hypothetical protein